MNQFPKRKNIRLKNYDYSQKGLYFITICTKDRECILSKIINKPMSNNVGVDCIDPQIELTSIGELIMNEIKLTEKIRKNIKIKYYIIMPNHIHMIIEIINSEKRKIKEIRTGACNAPLQQNNNGIDKIIKGLKGTITKQIGYSIWQRNYYEHIIRNEKEYLKIAQYIQYNPLKWKEDKLYK